MPRRKQMPAESPIFLTPREAAALDRLLDTYTQTEQDDPGMEDLKSVRLKIIRVGQDHTTYAQARGQACPPEPPSGTLAAPLDDPECPLHGTGSDHGERASVLEPSGGSTP